MVRHPKLRLVALEGRDVPAVVGFDQLAVDSQQYDPTHVLVKWQDGLAHATPVSQKAEPLGNGLFRITLTPGTTVPQAVQRLTRTAGIAFAQPDYRVFVAKVPNDPSFGSLWGLENTGQQNGVSGADISATEAWNTSTGTGRTIVAVIDTGVDYRHPDLAANMWRNPGEIPGNGLDDDSNGFKDDVYGYDFANNDANPMDDNGHGTHVAGTIGAVGNNGVGVAGVNWNARIMALKFLEADGSGYMSNAVRALNYAVKNGAKVVNASFGGGGYDPAMATAISNVRGKGVIVVAAAGNDGTNNDANPVYPANYAGDNVVTVAAMTRTNNLASYSNYGRTTVDLAAPGTSIFSTLPNGKYGTYSGTSMATPHVAGAMSLVWDSHPTWTYRQVIEAVVNGTDRVSALNGKVATGGRLNVARAIGTSVANPRPSDTTGPTVTGVTFTGTASAISTARVTFSEAIAPATFSAADVSFTGPGGRAITIASVTPVAGTGNTEFNVTFASQSAAGTYTMAIGPDVRDPAGNPMDQDRDGRAGESADRYSTTTTLTASQTLTSTNVGQAIPDFGSVTSRLAVTRDVTIRDLNVQVNVNHSFTGDVRLTLVAPDGTRVPLANRRGRSGDNFNSTVFDDEAGQSVWQGAAPFAGSFRPESSLTAFDGKSAKGTWRLIVEDTALFDTGKLVSWSLIVNDAAATATAVTPVAAVSRAREADPIDATGLVPDSSRASGRAHYAGPTETIRPLANGNSDTACRPV